MRIRAWQKQTRLLRLEIKCASLVTHAERFEKMAMQEIRDEWSRRRKQNKTDVFYRREDDSVLYYIINTRNDLEKTLELYEFLKNCKGPFIHDWTVRAYSAEYWKRNQTFVPYSHYVVFADEHDAAMVKMMFDVSPRRYRPWTDSGPLWKKPK